MLALIPEAFAIATHVSFHVVLLFSLSYVLVVPESMFRKSHFHALLRFESLLHVPMLLILLGSENVGHSYMTLLPSFCYRVWLQHKRWLHAWPPSNEDRVGGRLLTMGVYHLLAAAYIGVMMFRVLKLGSHVEDLGPATYAAMIVAEVTASLLMVVVLFGWPQIGYTLYQNIFPQDESKIN